MRKFTIVKLWCVMLWIVLGMGQAFGADCAADYVAPENPVWDGTSKEEPCTIGGYYIIDNAAKLAWYAAKGSDNAWNYTRGNARLTADIDLGGKLWTPIAPGNGGTRYNKIFDGKNHVIKNMYINGTQLAQKDKAYAQNLGFVGTLGNGTIKNLILEDVNIQASTNAGDILGRTDSQISVGAFVGWMADKSTNNIVDNCVVASGTIRTTGNGQGVGGIVGNAKIGTISNCLSLVEIHTSGSDAYIGGIIGITKTNVTVSSCVYAGPGLVNTGTNGLVGGIAGNVFSGTLATENNYFEGENISGVGGSICTAPDPKNCTPETSAASVNNAQATDVDFTNVENVACALNGTNKDGSCKEEPWSVGQTGLSLNGYGADGYKIVFNAKSGSFADGNVSKNVFLQKGMTISAAEIELPTHADSAFVGWSLDSTATEPAADLGSVSGATKVYAVWYPIFTVTFSAAPGTFTDGETDKTIQIAKNEKVTVEDIELPFSYTNNENVKYYFTGWALTENAPEEDTLQVLPNATENTTLYAVWTQAITYTVTYNDNGHGKTKVDFVRVESRQKTQAPVDPEADAGYVFVDWFKEPACINAFNFDKTEIVENWVLYAKWSPVPFSITYVMNEVGNKGENPESYNIETPTITLANPADVEGYIFEGWFNDAEFNHPANKVPLGSTGNKTFYAKWSKITYRIMYLADNNSQGAVTDQFKEYGTPFTLESAGYFNRKGYAQTGWATVAEGEKVYELGATYEENAALTLYPTWEIVTYTITYVCEGCVNNSLNPETYTVLTSTGIKYASSVPEGYKFGGWFSDKKFTKKVTQIEAGTVGNLTLYGKLNTVYSITYVGTDKPNSAKTYTVDDAVSLGKPTRTGYTFGGWYDNENFEGNAVTKIEKGTTGDKIFYAKWILEYGAITIVSNIDGTNSAVINGNYGGGDEPNSEEADAVEITSDITVNSVTLNRTFNANKIATLYVPFEIDAENVVGTDVYQFKTVVWNENDRRWKFKVSTATKIMPNTPYVIIPEGTQVTFDIPTSVTLNTTTEGEATAANSWEFVGAYQYEKFTLDNNKPVYLFADQARDGAKLGEFVKIADGAYINPMRAYLVYHKSAAAGMQKSASGNLGSNILLPDELDIEVDDENGIVVQTGRLNTVTGEVRMDRWYDLKGRKLNSKPTVKGTYYKNGKRVIVK